jgi:hypothetical protein
MQLNIYFKNPFLEHGVIHLFKIGGVLDFWWVGVSGGHRLFIHRSLWATVTTNKNIKHARKVASSLVR